MKKYYVILKVLFDFALEVWFSICAREYAGLFVLLLLLWLLCSGFGCIFLYRL